MKVSEKNKGEAVSWRFTTVLFTLVTVTLTIFVLVNKKLQLAMAKIKTNFPSEVPDELIRVVSNLNMSLNKTFYFGFILFIVLVFMWISFLINGKIPRKVKVLVNMIFLLSLLINVIIVV